MNLLTTPTTCVMSIHVATIVYINERIAGAYGIEFIGSLSEPDLTVSFRNSRRLAGSGVEVDRATCMLNRFKIRRCNRTETDTVVTIYDSVILRI